MLILVPIAFFWGSGRWTDAGTGLRFAHIFGSMILGLIATTYQGHKETIGFWHFGWLLVLRFLLGTLYMGGPLRMSGCHLGWARRPVRS